VEKAGLSDRKSNGIIGRTCLSVTADKVLSANTKARKKPLTVRGVPLGVVPSGRYNFNNLQIEVESIGYPGLVNSQWKRLPNHLGGVSQDELIVDE
jgi:hypothetical protein